MQLKELTCDTLKQLLCEVLDVPPREGLEFVFPQEVVYA